MWNVRLYYHTHLNTANTLDTASRLESASHIDVPALDILQAEGLSSIQVKATRAQVKNVEYVKLTDTESGDYFYYQAGIPVATSSDVQTIPIAVDGVLTMGTMYHGVSNIPFIDGVVSRHHVAKADDVYGAYTEDDPLLVPSKPLEIQTDEMFLPGATAEEDELHLIESTLSLDNMAERNDAVTYVEGQSAAESVTVPQVVPVQNNTRIIPGHQGSFKTAGTEYYDGDNEMVQEGIKRCRSLGVESGILNSWVIPGQFATVAPTERGVILGITGYEQTVESRIDFSDYGADNKRVAYGNLNTIVMISPANGSQVSFKPEDVAFANGSPVSKFRVTLIVDPRPAGRPYFIAEDYQRKAHTFDCALPGMQWQNAPLVYTGGSGSTLAEIKMNSSLARAGSQDAYSQASNSYNADMNMAFSMAGGLAGVGKSDFSMVPIQDFAFRKKSGNMYLKTIGYDINAGHVTGLAGLGLGIANTGRGYIDAFRQNERLSDVYNQTVANELQNFYLGATVVAPELHFPRSETIRELTGNCLIVAKYKPSTSDIDKLDKILTMYGYKDTIPLVGNESIFSNRSRFNYVKTSGVSIGGDAPKWLREATAMQLNAGVRIWHQIPDKTAYNKGQNV